MPRCFSISIQSEVAWRLALRAFTEPAIWIAPENSSSFSVSVVLPASGWEMMAKVRRRRTSGPSSVIAVRRSRCRRRRPGRTPSRCPLPRPSSPVSRVSRRAAALGAQVLGRRAAAVRAPPGRADEVADDRAQAARREQVTGERAPLVQLDVQHVVADHRHDQAVAARHVVALGAVGAEQAVEDDQHAAVVGVEVLEVGGVVDAMGRWRVEHVLEPASANGAVTSVSCARAMSSPSFARR